MKTISKRFAGTAVLALTYAFLASAAASYIMGQSIVVDGGLTATAA